MQQTSIVKLPAFFQKVQTKVHALKVNETKITTENTFNRDQLGIEDETDEANKDEKTLLCVFSQILDPYFNL